MFRVIAATVAIYLVALTGASPGAQAQQDGQSIFRFDTFGSEQLWTDVLQMQQVIPQGVSPATALSVGLKVDVEALPHSVTQALRTRRVNLDDPAVTVQLLKPYLSWGPGKYDPRFRVFNGTTHIPMFNPTIRS